MLRVISALQSLSSFEFDVCVTVHHRYNDIKSQLDATVTNFIDNYNQLNMFRAIISSILSRQHRRCIIPQAETQSGAPEDGRNYRPKHVELIVIINKICYCCI